MLYIKKSLSQVKAELEKDAARYAAFADAWGKVTIARKKNGEEFQNIKTAVQGARVGARPFFPEERELSIVLSGVPHQTQMYIDEISLAAFVDELPADDPRRAGGTVSGIVRRKIEISPEEARQRIAQHIADLKAWEAEKRSALATIDKDYTDYIAAIEAANAIATRHGERSATYYALCDVAK